MMTRFADKSKNDVEQVQWQKLVKGAAALLDHCTGL